MKIKTVFLTIVVQLTILAGAGGISGGSKPGVKKFGINEDSSWNEISKVVKNNPELRISGDYVFLGQPKSAFNVCVDGDHFRTIEKVDIIKNIRVPVSRDKDGDRDGFANVVVGQDYKTYPITYESTEVVCDNRDKNCKQVIKQVDQEIIKTIKVLYTRKTSSKHEKSYFDHEVLIEKEYIIPYCE